MPVNSTDFVQMGRFPAPSHSIIHLSDVHLLARDAPLYGEVHTASTIERAVEQLIRRGRSADAIVVTGDVADLGEADAYQRVRRIVDHLAEQVDAPVVWVMGNHDDRARFRVGLLDEDAADTPVTSSVVVNGLRIIALDSSVPGYHHGDLDERMMAWLVETLREPAEHGTLLALHHPPIPTGIQLMTVLELQHQERLAQAIAGTDVRAILAGHLHYTTSGLFAGRPVYVAPATAYTMDLSAPARELAGVDGGQAFGIVDVYADQVVSSAVPITSAPVVTRLGPQFLDRIEQASPAERIALWSKAPERPDASDPSADSSSGER